MRASQTILTALFLAAGTPLMQARDRVVIRDREQLEAVTLAGEVERRRSVPTVRYYGDSGDDAYENSFTILNVFRRRVVTEDGVPAGYRVYYRDIPTRYHGVYEVVPVTETVVRYYERPVYKVQSDPCKVRRVIIQK